MNCLQMKQSWERMLQIHQSCRSPRLQTRCLPRRVHRREEEAEQEEEAWLLARNAEALRADVLKVGHHGSRTSSSEAFLDAVAPRLALVSVGAGNRYRHPAPATLASFLIRNVPVLRTDLDGALVVRSDGRQLRIHTEAGEWAVPSRPVLFRPIEP